MGQTVLDFGITYNFDFVSYLLLFHVLCSIPQTTNIQIGTWVFFHKYCSLLHFPIPLTYNSPCLPAFCFTVDAFLAFSCVCVTQSTRVFVAKCSHRIYRRSALRMIATDLSAIY